jgi:carboxypeptidase Q
MKKLKMFRTALALIVFNAMVFPALLVGQASSLADVNARIREEGTKNSQVMQIAQVFTDVYGPRLTGSPSLEAAGQWAAKKMTEWGMQNAGQEPWNFGWPGWANQRASGHIISPVQDNLVFEVLAWTPSTNGVVKGQAVHMVLPERPTQDELNSYFASIRSRIKGNMILVGEHVNVPVSFAPLVKRLPDEVVARQFDPNAERPTPPFQMSTPPTPRPGALSPADISRRINAFLMENGAAVRINDAGRPHGIIAAFSPFRGDYDPSKTVPTVVLRNEDYGRITRLLGGGRDVELEFDIRNNTYPEGKTAYNTVAEIVGTDKKDEVIMLGGHLDSWHSATGATDNATGCAVMMEAARIIIALGLKPRRTIRVALWTGEEQGLLGSQAYVAQHFGTAEDPKPAWHKFGGYINHDTGTGRIRGLTVFGPPETADVLRGIVSPFADLGIAGAIATTSRNIGGTDHTSFNNAGLPGIGTSLDPIEYRSHTWHTNLDTYERLIPADLQQSAIIAAAVVYHLAMRDELLPRFPADKMPAAPRRGE